MSSPSTFEISQETYVAKLLETITGLVRENVLLSCRVEQLEAENAALREAKTSVPEES